jgi:Protein of unknown function (DUF3501)
MEPLTPDDLLPLNEYASRRRELADSHVRYLDRYRRVRVGPAATLLFENRQTAWFRAQELLRIARLAEPRLVQRELEIFNRLLPARNRLQAALVIDVADESRLTDELSAWEELRGDLLRFHIGRGEFPANLLTSRPEDRCFGTAHWVQFVLDPAGRQLLADLRQPAHFAITLPAYRHSSDRLSDEVRQSLLEDLALSDRDAA